MERRINVLDELKCPVCLEIPKNEIFLCMNGHNMCDSCLDVVKQCPQCRVSLEKVKIRNRTLEILLDNISLDCAYKSQGCQEKFRRKQLHEHGMICPYNGKQIDFCRILGLQCIFGVSTTNIPLAIAHFIEKHQFTTETRKSFPIVMEGFARAASLKVKKRFLESAYTPVILDNFTSISKEEKPNKYNIKTSPRLVILTLMSGKDLSTNWICVCLSNNPLDAQRFKIEFKLYSQSDKVQDLTWTTNAIHVNNLAAVLPHAPFRTPNSYLLAHYMSKAGSLWVDVSVSEIPKETEQSRDLSVPLEPTWIFNSVLPLRQSTACRQEEVIISGIKCNSCRNSPIKAVIYKSLQEKNYSLCRECIFKDSQRNRWLGVIRSAEDEQKLEEMWHQKNIQWSNSLFGMPLQSGYSRCMSSKECTRAATHTCLQCSELRHYSLCRQCYMDQCNDHIFAAYIRS